MRTRGQTCSGRSVKRAAAPDPLAGIIASQVDPTLCRIVSINPDAEINLDAALEVLQKAASGNGSDHAPLANSFLR
jgi:hypothetical protein